MFIQTHILIGKCIQEVIQENFHIKLSSNAFVYGNIKPDIDPRMTAISHYKNKSFQVIIEMILSLQKYDLSDYDKRMKKFSIQLGVINHYLTDFFCFAHNDLKMNYFISHLLYENKLAKKFHKFNLEEVCNKSINSIKNLPDIDVKQYIEFKHNEYIKSEPSIDKDICYSIEICSAVSYIIIYNCLNNHISKEELIAL